MKYSFYTKDINEFETDILAIGLFEDSLSTLHFQALDRVFSNRLSEIIAEEEFKGKESDEILIHTQGTIRAKRLLLLGLGKRSDFDIPEIRNYGARIVAAAQKSKVTTIGLCPPPLDDSALDRSVRSLSEGIELGHYRFDKYRSKEKEKTKAIKKIEIVIDKSQKEPHLSIAHAQEIATSINIARDLVNEPASYLTPKALADYASHMAKKLGLECNIYGPKDCEKLNMGLYLAVGKASQEEPRFIHLVYKPKGKTKGHKKIALIGKGVTFDSGGLSLKPSNSMLDMKCDMAGAAAVIGVMHALPALGIRAEVHALIAATENMISGSAYKLGDVIKGMNGKTVEICNTDAEGRLTLADALSFARKELKVDELIDIATLTGACMVALGPHMAGIMGNDNTLIEHFLAASRRSGEDVWKLPLSKKLKSTLDSKIADIKNVGDRWGGAITAGLFLKEFVEDTPWIHLDIAGPAFADKADGYIPKGGTGFGVAALIEHLSTRGSATLNPAVK